MAPYLFPALATVTAGTLGGFVGGWVAMATHVMCTGTSWAQDSSTISRLRSRSIKLGLVLGALSISILLIKGPQLGLGAAILAGFLAASVVSFAEGIAYVRKAKRTTPYDLVTLPSDDTPPDCSRKAYDVFISYRASDEKVARLLADWLLANGMVPWFDEYVILLSKRADVSESLSSGLQMTRSGIVLASHDYPRSEYTKRELEGLLRNCPADRIFIIEVDQEPFRLDPATQEALARCPHKTLLNGDIRDTLEWVARELKISGACAFPDTTAASEPQVFGYDESKYCFDATGWELVDRGGQVVDENVDGPKMARPLLSGERMFFNLIIGPAPDSWKRFQTDTGTVVDRRKMQMEMVAYARGHMKKYDAHCKGVHLLYLDNYPGVPHFAMTYWFHRYWVRRYSIILPNLRGVDTEFAFHFGVPGTFRQFCLQVPVMDALVRSLRWNAEREAPYDACLVSTVGKSDWSAV